MKSPRYHKNLTERDPCPVCHNEGWVILQGTERHHGYTYSRGSAPCHWCEAGTKAFTAAKGRRIGSTIEHAESNYQIQDVDGYDPNPETVSRKDAKALIAALKLGAP